ncbi:hypothetical protein HMPREF9946_02193 [Acetobacteraceae bacterium AT-5844]|nr:hypothetical protein HMPREF9946_02193 [Acetobacteraceae bacterium AT-5844]
MSCVFLVKSIHPNGEDFICTDENGCHRIVDFFTDSDFSDEIERSSLIGKTIVADDTHVYSEIAVRPRIIEAPTPGEPA